MKILGTSMVLKYNKPFKEIKFLGFCFIFFCFVLPELKQQGSVTDLLFLFLTLVLSVCKPIHLDNQAGNY